MDLSNTFVILWKFGWNKCNGDFRIDLLFVFNDRDDFRSASTMLPWRFGVRCRGVGGPLAGVWWCGEGVGSGLLLGWAGVGWVVGVRAGPSPSICLLSRRAPSCIFGLACSHRKSRVLTSDGDSTSRVHDAETKHPYMLGTSNST